MANNINYQFINSYSKDFADKIVANLPSTEDSVNGKALLSLTPSKQVNFFILKSLYGQWQDEMKKLESPYFNFKHEEVRKALTTYMNVLSQHIEVAPEDLKPLLEGSVVGTLSWLLAPGESLKAEVEEKAIKQLSAIKGISKYYKIYQDDLSYLISERSESEISEFLEEWDQLMDQKSKDSTIEKELDALSQVLEISIRDLVEMEDEPDTDEEEPEEEMVLEVREEVEESLTEEEDEPSEDEIVEDELEDVADDSEQEDEPTEDSSVTAESEEAPEEEEPVSNDYVHSDSSEEERVEMDDSLNQKFAKTEETLNDQFKEEQVSVAAKHQQKKISSILEAVSLNQEFMFTSELFGGEKDLFLEAVEKIETCNSFDESVEMLVSSYSKEYSWDMNSVEVKELLKVVFRRFR